MKSLRLTGMDRFVADVLTMFTIDILAFLPYFFSGNAGLKQICPSDKHISNFAYPG